MIDDSTGLKSSNLILSPSVEEASFRQSKWKQKLAKHINLQMRSYLHFSECFCWIYVGKKVWIKIMQFLGDAF